MTNNDLISISLLTFNGWFHHLKKSIRDGKISSEKIINCPKQLMLFESSTHYIIELIGSQPILDFSNLDTSKKINSVLNTSSHLNGGIPFDDSKNIFTLIKNEGKRLVLNDLNFTSNYDRGNFENKLKMPLTNTTVCNNANIPLLVGSNADEIILVNCNIIRSDPLRIFYRRLDSVIVVKKSKSKIEFEKFLINMLNGLSKDKFFGIHAEDIRTSKISQELLGLANQKVNEIMIDKLLANHADIFAKALGYKSARSNVKLKIVDKNGWDKEKLIPDYLMEKEDGSGNYDILDLKLGMLKSNLTRGGKSRRSLSSYATSLIAQLNGYKKYFLSDKNKKWAFDNQQIKISDNVLLIGIVGNQNHFFREEIDEALEVYKNNILFISYNELNELIRMV